MTEREKILKQIEETARLYPDRTAFEHGRYRLSYRELLEGSRHYGSILARGGSGPVLLYGHMECGMALGILACLKADRAYVPVDFFTPAARIMKIADICGASLMLCPEEEGTSSKSCPDLPGVRCLTLKQLEDSEPDKASGTGAPAAAKKTAGTESAGRASRTRENKTAYIIFTSGSTGEPKGVPVSYSSLANFIRWITGLAPLAGLPHQRILQQASFSFDLSVADFFLALTSGHTVVTFDGDVMADFKRLAELLTGIDMTVTTPAFMKLCLVNPDFCREHYPRFACSYCCGERLEASLAARLLRAFPDLVLINAYGPTEAASAVCAAVITRQMAEHAARTGGSLPVGSPDTAATEVTVEDGEIVLKGASVSDGYLGGITGGFYRENGENAYRTGDLGYIRDGMLYCNGRRDSQIKYKGYRIELHDIESNLARVKGVQDCAVVALRGKSGLVRGLRAFVAADTGVTEEGLRRELAGLVPAYMVPGTFVMVKRLPVTANGKTDRKALERYGAGDAERKRPSVRGDGGQKGVQG